MGKDPRLNEVEESLCGAAYALAHMEPVKVAGENKHSDPGYDAIKGLLNAIGTLTEIVADISTTKNKKK